MIRQFTVAEVGEVLQKMHDAEINVKIFWAGDSGIDWEIGDEKNGYKETSNVDASISNDEWGKIEYSVSALAYEMYRLFPKSDFGKWYASLDLKTPMRKL